ncbi:MAG: hypothetical protein O7C98_10705 [Planctomycetota bacterium]|nr:hypothetical protein [Planctomycetota bacterium]
MRALLVAMLCVASLAAAAGAAPEDPPAQAPAESEEVVVGRLEGGRRVPELDDAESKAYAILGWIDFEVEGLFHIKARRAVLWIDPKATQYMVPLFSGDKKQVPAWAIRALYAEAGGLPATFEAAGRTFRCASLYYDLRAHRGVVVDAELRIPLGKRLGRETSLYFHAARFRATKPGRIEADNVTVTTSPYVDSEVAIVVRRLQLDNPGVEQALGDFIRISARRGKLGGPSEEEFQAALDEVRRAGVDLAKQRVSMTGMTARFFGLPFLYVPRLTVTGITPPDLEYYLDIGQIGSLGDGVMVGFGRWKKLSSGPLKWRLIGGYVSGRGPPIQVDTWLDLWNGRLTGHSLGVYFHDEGSDLGVPPSTQNRYWTQNFYRFHIDPVWRLDGELALLSDEAFLRFYDEKVFKQGLPQETLLYLRGRGRAGYLTVTEKVRTISFLPELEELPNATGSLPVVQLFRIFNAPVQAQLGGSVGDLRQRAPGSGAPSFRTWRANAGARVTVTLDLGPFRIIPLGTVDVTGYEQDLAGDSLVRYTAGAGLRVDLVAHRMFGVQRHVVNFSFEGFDLYEVTQSSTLLFQMTPLDAVTPYESLSLRIRNRLQKPKNGGLRTYLDLELFGAYFPEGRRPLGRSGYGFFEGDLEWLPRDNVDMFARVSLDPDLGNTGSVGGQWRPRPDRSYGVMYRHLEGVTDVVTLQAVADITSRWRLLISSQFDVRNNDVLDQSVTVQRFGKQLVVDLAFGFDPGGNDFTFAFRLNLLQTVQKPSVNVGLVRDVIGWNTVTRP